MTLMSVFAMSPYLNSTRSSFSYVSCTHNADQSLTLWLIQVMNKLFIICMSLTTDIGKSVICLSHTTWNFEHAHTSRHDFEFSKSTWQVTPVQNAHGGLWQFPVYQGLWTDLKIWQSVHCRPSHWLIWF